MLPPSPVDASRTRRGRSFGQFAEIETPERPKLWIYSIVALRIAIYYPSTYSRNIDITTSVIQRNHLDSNHALLPHHPSPIGHRAAKAYNRCSQSTWSAQKIRDSLLSGITTNSWTNIRSQGISRRAGGGAKVQQEAIEGVEEAGYRVLC